MADDAQLTILGDGSMVVEPSAEKRLGALQGRYRLVPAGGEMVILQKVLPEGASPAAGAGRVVLAGEIDRGGGLVDIINFICGNAWSGQLAVLHGTVRKTIYFRRGDISTAASNVPEDRLGAILYRFGMISEEALSSAVSQGGATRLGQRLVEQGALTAHELYTYVRKQVEEIFFSVVVLRQGDFYFYRTLDDAGPPSQLQLSAKGLLFDGVRRIDELSYFREKLPNVDVILQKREPQPQGRLEPLQQKLLGLVDGKSSLADLSRLSHMGEFDTTKLLYQLLQGGFVQPRPATAALFPETVTPGEHPHETVVLIFNEVYRRVFAAVSAKGRLSALQKDLQSFFGSAAEFAPLFVGLDLAEDGSLPKDQLLANLEFAPTDSKLDYLRRGLNELLFFELFTAGEAVDPKEEIELHRRLNEILKDIAVSAQPLDAEAMPEVTIEEM